MADVEGGLPSIYKYMYICCIYAVSTHVYMLLNYYPDSRAAYAFADDADDADEHP
jgi:hypothetical protein